MCFVLPLAARVVRPEFVFELEEGKCPVLFRQCWAAGRQKRERLPFGKPEEVVVQGEQAERWAPQRALWGVGDWAVG